MQSSGSVTSCPRSSASLTAHGSRLYLGSGPFLGRPRWLAHTSRPPRSSTCLMVGSASRMRESSVIVLPSSGTLKSTRKKTRLFSTGSSRTVRIPWSGLAIVRAFVRAFGDGGCGSELGGDELRQLDHPVREPPLVVVPREDLGKLVAHQLSDGCVEARRVRVADVV